jgi:hypothetical protein
MAKAHPLRKLQEQKETDPNAPGFEGTWMSQN